MELHTAELLCIRPSDRTDLGIHNHLQPWPQQTRDTIKESIQHIYVPGLHYPSVGMRQLDHQKDADGIVAVEQVVFCLLEYQA